MCAQVVDRLGPVVAVSDADGDTVHVYKYSVFGHEDATQYVPLPVPAVMKARFWPEFPFFVSLGGDGCRIV